MSGSVRASSYRGLRVYALAEDAAMRLYQVTRSFPREELYSLTAQACRSSRSVCANIAEAWQKRRYPAAFTAKLTDAAAEADETRVWLSFADRCGFLAPEIAREMSLTYSEIVGMLVNMAAHPERWRTGRFPPHSHTSTLPHAVGRP